MDLATLKVEVKAWEKAFKARENRPPTKDDIKKDLHGIGDKYAMYRKLVKQQSSTSTSTSHPPSSAQTSSTHATSSAGPSRQTPRNIPSLEYPTTPTPHSRRSSISTQRSNNLPSRQLDFGESIPSKPPKRPFPTSPTKSPNKSFITPKKHRPTYSGPIVDPNPINPFSSPVKSSASRSLFVPGPAPSKANGESPFLHANSPRKLKELLEANSLRKMKQRAEGVDHATSEEITPRSKARLRLAGDFTTPLKDKRPVRKRGQARVESVTGGKEAMRMEDEMRQVEEMESEDEFGPSPIRPGPSRTFTELLQSADEPPDRGFGSKRSELKTVKGRGDQDVVKSASILSFFAKPIKQKVKVQLEEPPEPSELLEDSTIDLAKEVSGQENDILENVLSTGQGHETEEDGERLSNPPTGDAIAEIHSPTTDSQPTRIKVVEFSDDEIDEWDPEGGNVRRKIVITGTRRNVRRRNSSPFSSRSGEDDDVDYEDVEDGSDEEEQRQVEFTEDGEEDEDQLPSLTTTTTIGSSSTNLSSPRSTGKTRIPLLSLLSIRSPPGSRTHTEMTDLRVKAIFNPVDAVKLRARRKGQDVYISGQGEDLSADEILDKFADGREGIEQDEQEDDDWEEECEGWKRTPLGMDDDDW